MSKFDFIDWEATQQRFGYINKRMKPTDKVVCHCLDCQCDLVYAFHAIRTTKGKPFKPRWRSCRGKRMWQNLDYRSHQTAKQSVAMRRVWQVDGYRANQRSKHRESTKLKWRDRQYRRNVVAGMCDAHRTKAGYTKAATRRLQQHSAKRIEAIRRRYEGDPAYSQKLSSAGRANYTNPNYVSKIRATQASPAYRQRLSTNAKKLWCNPEYAKKIMENRTSKLEVALAAILTDLRLDYEPQYILGSWPFDFCVFLGSVSILIEVNGNYWHSLPKQIVRDKTKRNFVRRHHSGNHVLRYIWEGEFKSPATIARKIKRWVKQLAS